MHLLKNHLLTNVVRLLQRVEQPLGQVDDRADVAKQPVEVHVLHLQKAKTEGVKTKQRADPSLTWYPAAQVLCT